MRGASPCDENAISTLVSVGMRKHLDAGKDGACRVIATMPEDSVKDPYVIDKKLSQFEARCRSQWLVNRRPRARAPAPGACQETHQSKDDR